jgi:putative tryptophan/tyrosine transport system substrate-binding protein
MIGRRSILQAAAAVAMPTAGFGQPARGLPRLGVLLYGSSTSEPQLDAVRQGLRAAGYEEGRSLAIEYRLAEGKPERLPALAADLVATRPDVILALGGDVAPFALHATQTIPIVFAISSDPAQIGLVKSLRRPGGNATGVTFLQDDLAAKRLQIFAELVPSARRVALLRNPEHLDNERENALEGAQGLGIALQSFDMRHTAEVEGVLQAAREAQVEALYVVSSRFMVQNLARFVAFAAAHQLHLIGGWGAWAKAGALMSYGPNVVEMVASTAAFIDKLFKGNKPGDMPVQQPTRFELIVNARTARDAGLVLPASILALASEIVE